MPACQRRRGLAVLWLLVLLALLLPPEAAGGDVLTVGYPSREVMYPSELRELFPSPPGERCYRVRYPSLGSRSISRRKLLTSPEWIGCRLKLARGAVTAPGKTGTDQDFEMRRAKEVPPSRPGSTGVKEPLMLGAVLVTVIVIVVFFYSMVALGQSPCWPDEIPVYVIPETSQREGRKLGHHSVQAKGFELGVQQGETRSRKKLPNVDVTLAGVEIGSGGFGVVEKGFMGDREVAVKFKKCIGSDTKNTETLLNEAKVLEQVPPHKNVVSCFGVCEDDRQRIGIVEELLDGNLAEWMGQDNFRDKTTVREALEVFIGITKGLEHLHQFKVVHYDLKPQNVLLDLNLVPKLADFGCSKFKASSYITAGVFGTIGYLAPECVFSLYYHLKQRVCAEKIDVYSLGIIISELMFGTGSPHSRTHMFSSMRSSHQASSCSWYQSSGNLAESCDDTGGTGYLTNNFSHRFQIPSGCPEELRLLVADCTNINNKSRPTCSSVRGRLEAMQEAPWAGHTLRHVIGH